jgi:hypothetical protein
MPDYEGFTINRAGGLGKPGVAGAATEHPLEGVAEDPAGRDIQKRPLV